MSDYWLGRPSGRQRLVCMHNSERICAECRRDYERTRQTRWRRSNPEKTAAKLKRWYERTGRDWHNRRYKTGTIDVWQQQNPERVHANKMKYRHKMRGVIYGPGQTRASLRANAKSCKICSRDFSTLKSNAVHLDHDHAVTDRPNVRGFLCRRCNHTLGAVGDSVELLQLFIDYLVAWRSAL